MHKVITIHNTQRLAIMTSGTYRNYFSDRGVRYSHILDARTGYPVKHSTVSVTVLHKNATVADAWSTALLCLGREAGINAANTHNIAALFIEQVDNELSETYSKAALRLPGIEIQ